MAVVVVVVAVELIVEVVEVIVIVVLLVVTLETFMLLKVLVSLLLDERATLSRLLLCEATKRTMAQCFHLLGIGTLERI